MACGIEGSIGPVRRDVVRQGHVPGAEAVIDAERAEGVLDRMATFHTDQGSDAMSLELAFDVRRRERECKAVRVTSDDAPRNVDLLQLYPRVSAVLDLTGDVDRPELGANLACLQPRQIRMATGLLPQIVGRDVSGRLYLGPASPRQIVVAIDERNRLKNLANAGEVRRRRGLRRHSRSEKRER